MAQPRVFLSHSSKDATFTQQLEADLRGAGAIVYRVSADQGGEFQRRIDEALIACEWVVLVLTKDALASTWVQQEIYAAIRLRHDGRIREILPIQAGTVDHRAIPPLWGVYNIFDATRDYPSARDAVLRALGASVSAPAVDPSILPPLLARLGFAAYRNGSVDYILPPVVSVPAGEFLMGSDPARDKGANDDEKPQHKVSLPAFPIGKFPLTVAEYACFVRSEQKRPRNWQGQLGKLDHPVVYVSWHDAVAYAAWLAKLTGQPWRLPSEAEWEKAARGADGRMYPWGDSFDKARCNTSARGPGATTPVGSYPSGASPYGAQDMAGNVWEWTSSLREPYPYTLNDGRENGNTTDSRVQRGGSWFNYATDARAAYRGGYRPDYVRGVFGFRLVRAAPGSV